MLPSPSHDADAERDADGDDRRRRSTRGRELVPDRTTVAGPVRVDSAISRTGVVSVEVKYSVRRLSTWASTRPVITAPKHSSRRLMVLVVADVDEGHDERCRRR